jgi:hypothetical protein
LVPTSRPESNDEIWINGVGDLKMSGTGSLANATVIGNGNIAVPHVAKK